MAGTTQEWFRVDRRHDQHPLGELSCIPADVVRLEIANGTIPSRKRNGVVMVHRDEIERRLARVPIPEHTARWSSAPKGPPRPRAAEFDEDDL